MFKVDLTEAAKEQVNKICLENAKDCVYLSMTGGGCAGFEYDWGLKDRTELTKTDHIIETGTGCLAIAGNSIMFLMGSQIDYVSQMFGSMFEIKNPNAQSACGCGISINFDDSIIEKAANYVELK